MEKNKGARAQGRPPKGGLTEQPPKDTSIKLSDLGITKTQLSRWQALAAMPRAEREEKIERAKKKRRAALDGTAKLERAEMRAADETRVRALVPRPGRYRTLVIDPPRADEVAGVPRVPTNKRASTVL